MHPIATVSTIPSLHPVLSQHAYIWYFFTGALWHPFIFQYSVSQVLARRAEWTFYLTEQSIYYIGFRNVISSLHVKIYISQHCNMKQLMLSSSLDLPSYDTALIAIYPQPYNFNYGQKMETFYHCKMTQTLHTLYSMHVKPGIVGHHRTMVDIFNIDHDVENLNIDVYINISISCQMTPPVPVLYWTCVNRSPAKLSYDNSWYTKY